MQILVFSLGILLFISLVLVHEWGHFIMARRNGVQAEEFGLFFPPRLWSRKLKSGMRLSFNLLPLGGFVKLKGEHDEDSRKGSLGAASLSAKTKIMLAGVTMNLILGLVFLMILAWIGMPKLLTKDNVGVDQFTVKSDTHITKQAVLAGAIIPDTPAQQVGLKSTDTILKIQNPTKDFDIKTTQNLHDATVSSAGQIVKITYQKGSGGAIVTKQVRLLSLADIVSDLKNQSHIAQSASIKKITDLSISDTKTHKNPVSVIKTNDDFYTAALTYYGDNLRIEYQDGAQTGFKNAALNPKAYLGLSPNQVQIQRSTWSAPIVAVGLTGQIFRLTFDGLGHALGGLGSAIAGLATHNHQARENGQSQASSQVGGPVAIGYALWNVGNLGFNFMLFLIALISLTLALMNVLPIPALDGGRLFMMLVSRGIFRRPLSRLAEERIVGASFLVLLALIALITLVDVKRFF